MKDPKRYAAIILILFAAATISAQTYNLKGWATTTGSGTLNQGNWGMFATFGQPAAGMATQGNYTLYMGVIRPGSVFSISGYTKYYKSPNFYPVANTEMLLTGGQLRTTLTDVNGYYSLDALTGFLNDTVTPRKINATNQTAVTSFDAALILRHVVGVITLDSLQRIAADVSGNGSISSFDAAQVLQYAVGIRHHFSAGYRPGSDTVDWAFRPASRNYSPLQSNQANQNYVSILYGDVSGNWSPSAGILTIMPETDNLIWGGNLPKSEDKIEYRVQDKVPNAILSTSSSAEKTEITTQPETQKTEFAAFPIRISNAKNVVSADIVLTYNPEEIVIQEVTLGTSTTDYLIAWSNAKRIIRIGVAGTRLINGEIEMAKVAYQTKGESEQAAPIKISSIVLNEGQEPIINQASDGVAGNKAGMPTDFSLSPNQPNPFKTQTAIRYSLPAESRVSLQVYDVSGTLIKTLVNQTQNPGFYSIRWDGTDNQNQKVASGIYFYEISAENFKAQKKLTVLR